ncbi:head-tail connector protein [Pelagibacterium lentulum]|uniref:Phage gp6-like head-tail connector protein n=1 Tax=Pelagibacterium lentulum TaxID=2029865 RepID=A0A916RNI0_9HYPH|nr:head-tail connector protein [Pelagibacterium lentulum]GGA63852.1 hypothetical protein GCM10011499_37800 [Pelagibacterium lentulum]
MHKPVQVTAPANMPVSLPEAKKQCRLDDDVDDEDDLIEMYIAAATGLLDGYNGILGRCLIEQEWRQDFDRFCRTMRLPLLPSGIVSITWRDRAGQISTIGSANYRLLTDALGGYVQFRNDYAFPTDLNPHAAISITFKAGYGPDPTDIPGPIRQAIRMTVAHWNANREGVNVGNITTELPLGVEFSLSPYKTARI